MVVIVNYKLFYGRGIENGQTGHILGINRRKTELVLFIDGYMTDYLRGPTIARVKVKNFTDKVTYTKEAKRS